MSIRRPVIGITGFATSGKDTAADALVAQRGFVKVSFADPLRESLAELNPIVGKKISGMFLEDVRYQDAVAEYGYDVAKHKFPEIRELLQRFGTEVGRKKFGENFWVEQAARKINNLPEGVPVVIPDVRFPNEVDIVHDLGGSVVRINRPGISAVNGHVSDTSVANLEVESELLNFAGIEQLRAKILSFADAAAFRILDQPVDYSEGGAYGSIDIGCGRGSLQFCRRIA